MDVDFHGDPVFRDQLVTKYLYRRLSADLLEALESHYLECNECFQEMRGTELLIPDLEGRVTIFDKDNKLVVHLGDNPDPKRRGPAGHKMPPDQWKDGLFHNPHGACYDKDGNIYVTEWLEPIGRVTKLKKLA